MLSKSIYLLFCGYAASFPWGDWDHPKSTDPYYPVESSVLSMLKTSAKYASAAYCLEENILDWSCGDRCVGELNVTTYIENSDTEMAGYIGYNKQDKKIVVSFRGTSNLENWIMDLDFFPRKYVYPNASPDTEVHRGFYETYTSVEKQVRSGLAKTLSMIGTNSSDYELLITGHSLGAAVATLGALDIKRIYLNPEHQDSFARSLLGVVDVDRIHLHNYGSPRVGNAAFADLAYSTFNNGDDDFKRICRVTNQNDIVPRVPPEIFGFLHTPQEVWINYDESTVNCHDVVNGVIVEDSNCNAGQFPMSVAAHLKYWDIEFGSGCN